MVFSIFSLCLVQMTVSLVGSHNILEIRENRFNVIKKEMLQKEPRSIKIYPVEIRRKLPTATELPRGDEKIEPEPLSFKDAADADVTSAELEPENSWIKPRRYISEFNLGELHFLYSLLIEL